MTDMLRRKFLKGSLGIAGGLVLPAPRLLAQILGDNRLVEVRHSTFVMGQIANVTLFAPDRESGAQAATIVFQEFRRLDRALSVFDPGSDVSRVNNQAGRASVCVGEDTRQIIRRSREVSIMSGGALDITIEPLMRLWGFRGLRRRGRPTDREIITALDAVGIQLIKVDGDQVGLVADGAAIDLGGVAVGYALDRAAAIVRQAGLEHGLIELSGDFIAIGGPPEQKAWQIGLEDPRVAYRVWSTVGIRDQGLSTSGNYSNVVVYNARRFGHILDPEVGRPAGRRLGTTVIAPTAFQADALSTACFVRGVVSVCDDDVTVLALDG